MQTAIYPMKVMRFSSITTGAHAKCRNGNPSDKPIDLVGIDSGKDWFYAPCDVVCLKVYNKASHGLWFRSVDKVLTPSGEKYLYFLAEHMSVSGFKVGKTYKKGTKLFLEGAYGNASGNHIHSSWGISDKAVPLGSGWRRNSKGAWVLYVSGVKNVEINKALFLDKAFTKTIKDTRLKWVQADKPEKDTPTSRYEIGKTYTLQDDMNIRIGHSVTSAKVGVSKWTANAKQHATKDGLLAKGTRVTCLDLYEANSEGWVKTPSGWICGYSNTKVYIK